MASHFKIIYKILLILRDAMEFEKFDSNSISHEALGISYPLWCRLIYMLYKEGYIEGIQEWKPIDSDFVKIALVRPEITLKGLEYLEENSLMQKAKNLAKDVIEVIK